tara:strand:+ start:3818 stop:4438 length:621 start_codon:yes stop_codon:yes gene_type:complete
MALVTNLLGFTCLISGYFLGSIPTGYLAGKWIANIDLREIGSGSTGATNVLRQVGKIPAFIVFIIDVAKGMAPVLLAKSLKLEDIWQVAAGIAALGGHIWPIWLKWKGGKAVASGLGVFLGLSWPVGFASLGIFLTVLSLSKIVSLSSVIASIGLPILMFLSFEPNNVSYAYLLISLIAMGMVLWRHRSNIKRLIKGVEPKIGEQR